jgi:hypothetical protein
VNIAFPSNTPSIISSIIDAIGREVTFYTPTLSGCTASGCSLDPITDTSTNSFCTVCSGSYWIKTFSGYTVKAHVTWKFADFNEWQTGGYVFAGDGIIKVMYSGGIETIIENADYAIVDDKEVNIEKITLLGVPSINRVICDFKEKEK